MKFNRKLILVVSTLAALGTVALAVWLTGFHLTGSFIASSGSKDVQEESWNINITNSSTLTNSFNYVNPDGSKVVSITLLDGISSADPNCNYEYDKDVSFYLNKSDSTECHLTAASPCSYMMLSGSNEILIKVVPAYNRCPLNGTYEIGFVV